VYFVDNGPDLRNKCFSGTWVGGYNWEGGREAGPFDVFKGLGRGKPRLYRMRAGLSEKKERSLRSRLGDTGNRLGNNDRTINKSIRVL